MRKRFIRRLFHAYFKRQSVFLQISGVLNIGTKSTSPNISAFECEQRILIRQYYRQQMAIKSARYVVNTLITKDCYPALKPALLTA